ncbi:MAG: site-2 protease family protein, partial [Opitutaceae bacterium]|nr:site-2 protease family protein [Opitutaceae bacterium]
ASTLSTAGIFFIILLCSLALHEFAHAWVADKRGDPLPRAQGRVTLDPTAHLDPVGSLLIPGMMILLSLSASGLPFFLLGWGKPVQISLPNPKTRRLDDILITLAGPGMNLLLALLLSIATGVAVARGGQIAVERFFLPAISLNICLAVFNLIPIPPLDGSHILRHVIGMSEELYTRLCAHGWWILLILINLSFFREFLSRAILETATPFLLLAESVARLFGVEA